jgi:hypothetical protein
MQEKNPSKRIHGRDYQILRNLVMFMRFGGWGNDIDSEPETIDSLVGLRTFAVQPELAGSSKPLDHAIPHHLPLRFWEPVHAIRVELWIPNEFPLFSNMEVWVVFVTLIAAVGYFDSKSIGA